jgi:outer membrane protein W
MKQIVIDLRPNHSITLNTKKMRTKKFNYILVAGAIVLSAFTNISKAADNGRFSVGAELGLPMGDFGDAANLGFGGTLRYEMPIGDNLGLTGTAGYIMFSGKDQDILGVTIKGADWSMIPIQVGAKYYFQEQQDGFYGMVELGVHATTVKTPSYTTTFFGVSVTVPEASASSTDLSYAPAIGYHLANVDIGLRYQMIATTGATTSYLGLRLAYVFGEK